MEARYLALKLTLLLISCMKWQIIDSRNLGFFMFMTEYFLPSRVLWELNDIMQVHASRF